MRQATLAFCLSLALGATAALAADAAKPAPAKPTEHKMSSHAMSAKGDISKVDAATMSFAVKGEGKDAKEEMYTYSSTTKFEMKGGKSAKADDLKSGMDVEVWYTMKDGKREATKVLVTDKH